MPPPYCLDLTNELHPPFPEIMVSDPISYWNGNIGFSDVQYANDNVKACGTLAEDCFVDAAAASQLVYKVYYPKPNVYPNLYIAPGAPCYVFFHQSGFSDCFFYTDTENDYFCSEMAKRGMVVCNCEYRRGRLMKSYDVTSVQQVLASYRACQDARGALRSIIKSAINGGFNEYPIDYQNRFFVGGMSAGALMMMNAVYYRTLGMVNAAFPSISADDIHDVLGGIDNLPIYYGESNNTLYDYKQYVKGVMLCWGGHAFPLNTNLINFFTQGNPYSYSNPPVIIFHGAKDKIFPISPGPGPLYDDQYVYFATYDIHDMDNYNATTNCLNDDLGLKTYQLDINLPSKDVISISSLDIYNLVHTLGKPCEAYVDCQANHGLEDDGTMLADYGTGYANANDVRRYIAIRTVTFFQAILNGYTQTQLGNTFFQDCVNNRSGCNTPNANCPLVPNCF